MIYSNLEVSLLEFPRNPSFFFSILHVLIFKTSMFHMGSVTNNFTLRPVFRNNFSRVRTIAVESFQLDGVTQVGEKIVLK